MVTSDRKERAWASGGRREDTSESGVHRFARAQCRLPVTCVPNHVWIRQVRNDQLLFATFNGCNHRVRNLSRPHLRGEIVGRNARAWDQEATLTRKRLLSPR